MAHIAVIGKPSRKRFQVTNQLQMQLGLHVTIFTSLSEVRHLLDSKAINLVVLIEEKIRDTSLVLMDEFTERHAEVGLIFVAYDIPATVRTQFGSLKLNNCTLIDYSRESQHVKPVIQKMLQKKPVFVRKHYRHKTNQVGFLNSARHIQNTRIRVMDISKGGLMATFQNLKLRVGETVHVLMATGDGTRQHRIVGKVVWLSQRQRQFGVQYSRVSVEMASMSFSSAR